MSEEGDLFEDFKALDWVIVGVGFTIGMLLSIYIVVTAVW
jgi:hypothetical protein